MILLRQAVQLEELAYTMYMYMYKVRRAKQIKEYELRSNSYNITINIA